MYNVPTKIKKLMYGKHAVVHESRYFIQARRALRRATMLTWNTDSTPRQLLPHAVPIISNARLFATAERLCLPSPE